MNENAEGFVEPAEKIVLSGASGMLGSALRTRLTEQGVRFTQLVRHPSRVPGELPWDPDATPPLASPAELENHSAAVHLSGASLASRRWTASYRRTMAVSRVDSTRTLAAVLAGLRNPPRALIVASAVGIYGDRGEELLDESAAPGRGYLADLCRGWEAAAQPARDAGIRVVHARFGVVLGRGPGALDKMLPVFRLGLGGKLGSGRQWMSWICLEDAVSVIRFVLQTPELAGPVNVTSPHPVRNQEFTHGLARALHRPAMFPVPAFALRAALGPMADEALLTSTRALPNRLLAAGFKFAAPTLDQALALALR